MRTGITRTTSFQITLLYVALSGVTLSILLGVIYWFSIGYLERQTDATIEAEIQGLAEHYRRNGLPGLTRVIRERIAADPARRRFYLFTDANLSPLAGNLARWPDPRPAGDGWLEFDADGAVVRARYFVLQRDVGLGLLLGRDVHELQQMTSLFRRAIAIGLAVTLLLSLIGGGLISARVLRRVDGITQAARRIMEGDLAQRMPTRGTGDEFDQLAEHTNAMLARIDTLMQSVRLVADNVAHDLRTPLTRLRNRLESLAGAPAETLRSELDACVADADQLLATFQALLRIARLRSGTYATTLAPVDLGDLAHDAAELYQAVAEARGLRLDTDTTTGCLVAGDRDLLFQAVSNLLDNAIKYTPEGGRLTLAVDRAAGHPRITVTDTGPGIPASMRVRVLEPFFRLDRSRSAPGNGLGLSLVNAIAEHHRATVRLADAAPGLAVSLEFAALAAARNGA